LWTGGSDIFEAQFERVCVGHYEAYEYSTARLYTGRNWRNLVVT